MPVILRRPTANFQAWLLWLGGLMMAKLKK